MYTGLTDTSHFPSASSDLQLIDYFQALSEVRQGTLSYTERTSDIAGQQDQLSRFMSTTSLAIISMQQ